MLIVPDLLGVMYKETEIEVFYFTLVSLHLQIQKGMLHYEAIKTSFHIDTLLSMGSSTDKENEL